MKKALLRHAAPLWIVALALVASPPARARANPGDPCIPGATDAHLLETIEVHCTHDDLVAKANELETPLRIFEFVHDEIEYEVYYGSKKGALGALWSGTGNDFDQASLLIALLRARGIRARYVVGVVDVPDEQVLSWVKTQNLTIARNVFTAQYCYGDVANTPVCANGRFSTIPPPPASSTDTRFEHAWVEAELPAIYRGLEMGASQKEWIPLDPSWKQKKFQDRIAPPLGDEFTSVGCNADNICFDYDAYYSKLDPRLASEIYEAQIREWLASAHPGKTLADLPYDGPIRPVSLEVLPLSLPFDPVAGFPVSRAADVGSLTPAIERRFRIRVALCTGSADCDGSTDLFRKTLALPDLVTNRITLSFEPANAEAQRAVLDHGGYLGGPFSSGGSTYDSLADYCRPTGTHSTEQKCKTTPVLKIDGEAFTDWDFAATQTAVPLASAVSLDLDRDLLPGSMGASYLAGFDSEVDHPLVAGDYVALALDAAHAGPAQFQERVDGLLALRESVTLVDEDDDGDTVDNDNGNQVPGEVLIDQGTTGITTGCDHGSSTAMTTCDIALAANFARNDDFTGELLHLVALRYYQRMREETDRVLALDGVYEYLLPAVGVARAGLSVDYLFDRAVGVTGARPVIDIRGFTFAYIGGSVSATREGKLLSHVGSALEHQVWEEITGQEFVSTVKGFQLVSERFPEAAPDYPNPIVEITAANDLDFGWLDDFPFDRISSGTLNQISQEASNSKKFTVPVAAARGSAGGAEVFMTRSGANFGMLGQVDGVTAGVSVGLDREQSLIRVPPDDPNRLAALAGDPVSMVSGNHHLEERDLLISTHGPPFEFVRAYNSQSDHAGELGFGWSHSFEVRVAPVRIEQVFAYPPSSLSGFDDLGDVEGARSDTLETWSKGGSGQETVTWSGLPAAFTSRATIERLELELAYQGAFEFELQRAGQTIQGPLPAPSSAGKIAIEGFELQTTDVSTPLELKLNNFGSTDLLYYARLLVHFRGPTLERVELPRAPSETGWTSLTDDDPSTCTLPTANNSTLTYPAPPDTEGAFAVEVSVAVVPGSNDPRAILWLGSPPPGAGVSFHLGPNENRGARERFLTTNTSHLATATYVASRMPRVELCHLERTLLRFRQQVELVLETGVRERFTRVGSLWDPAPGVRDQLADSAGGGYVVTRPDGRRLELAQPRGDEWRLSELSDAQGRSLIFLYNGTTGLLERVEEEGASTRALVPVYSSAACPPPLPPGTCHYLSQLWDWSGRSWRYTVDAAGDLVEVRDALAVQKGWPGVRYEYESGHVENPELDHNLSRVVHLEDRDSTGGPDRWIEFAYYNNDKVASHTDSLGNTQTFLFNVPRLENQTTDPRGFTTVYRHDADGNLVQRRDPDGAVWQWEYDTDRNVTREVDPFGRARRFCDFDARGNPKYIVDAELEDASCPPDAGDLQARPRPVELTYDPTSGAPAAVTDKRENTRTVLYTPDGLPQETRATIGGQAAPGTLLATAEYDPTSRRLTRTREFFQDDGTGRSRDTRFFYEAPGDPTDRDLSRAETRDESGSVTSTVEYLYDTRGRRTHETAWRKKSPADPSPIALVTQTTYNARDQIERVKRPDATTLVVEYDRNGNPKRRYLEEARPDGTLVLHDDTQLLYDAMDRLVGVIDAAGGTTEYGYDASGNRVSMQDPEGHTWRFEHDAMNRPIRAIDPNGAVTATRYDEAGRVVETIDPTKVVTTRGYDAVGRLVSFQEGSTPAATRAYFHHPVPAPCVGSSRAYCEKVTDPKGRTTTYVFDDLGRVSRVADALGGVLETSYYLTGQVLQVKDPAPNPAVFATFLLDTRGRVVSSDRQHASAVTTFVYDETGNPIRQTNPDGCVLEMTYDVMGRLTRRETANTAGGCANDPVDDHYGYDARGLLVAAKNAHVGLVREYDPLSRMTREIDSRFGTSVGYAWDGASRLASKVYPDGSTVHYSYDGAGRTVGISDPFGDTTRFLYDAAGRRLQKRGLLGGVSGGSAGLRTDYAYDGLGRLTSLLSFDANGGAASRFTYPAVDYDAVGNRERVEDATPPATPASPKVTLYGYDDLDRLETVDPPNEAAFPANGALTHFAYAGSFGNRTDFGPKSGSTWLSPHRSYEYDARRRLTNLRLNGAIDESLGFYDDNGNPTRWTPPGSSARTLQWDALGRLVAITGGFSASYVYDPFGRRIEKTEQGAGTIRYQYDGLEVVAEYDGAPTPVLQATYVFGPGIDEVLKIERGTTVAAYHTDGLGSVTAITVAGTARNTYRYDAFGGYVGLPGGTGPLPNAYAFTGRERDASELYYYRARYYLASAGRFLTPDPIGLVGGINPYVYVGSNPVNFTDPFGLDRGRARGPGVPDGLMRLDAIIGGTGLLSQSVTGTFGVPVVPGAGSVRTELFIAAESAMGLAGDARGFDAAPNPSNSRAFFTLDFESGAGAFQINPTCAAGGGSCNSALPIGAGNSFSASVSGNSVTVTGSLTNSKITIGPSIDFGIRFNAGSSGVTFSGYRNAFPSYEITRGSTFLYRGAETHPLRLLDATGMIRFSGP